MTKPHQPEGDLSAYSMTELFRIDAENQLTTLSEGLLAIGPGVDAAPVLEALMRAAHSIKGAARVVDMNAAVAVAHAMEDVFVLSQQKNEVPDQDTIDLMLYGVDLLRSVIFDGDDDRPGDAMIAQFIADCQINVPPIESTSSTAAPAEPVFTSVEKNQAGNTVRSLRIGSDNLDRLIALAGETRITLNRSGRFNRTGDELYALQQNVRSTLKNLTAAAASHPHLQELFEELSQALDAAEQHTAALRTDFEEYSFHVTHLGDRLYSEALTCRMRPFADCILPLRRLVRDLSRSLEKPCRLVVRGEATEVDRDILERLEAALTHLIRNALAHGVESAAERALMGKAAEAVITLTAAHVSGRLVLRLSDDGRGIDIESVRHQIVQRGLISASSAADLTTAEVMEFLFLPGFSMSESLSELSGRGVGLDAVRAMTRNLRGTVRIFSTLGGGASFELSLPVSQAVARCLLIDIAGTPCALPLARVEGVFRIPAQKTGFTEGRQHCEINGARIGLINAAQVLELDDATPPPDPLPVIVLDEAGQRYGIIVNDFLGQEELLLQPLDPALGKIRDLSATALISDGTPALVLDDEDFLLSIRNLATEGKLRATRSGATAEGVRKRVLVVDDSLTVRELERKLLSTHGYEVTTAVDGIDGWKTLRENKFDLIITDVDMPRMDGIELVEKIRSHTQLRDLPVMIVSYKDRPEDRQRGLEAGADYYLAKSSFHSDELALMVSQLIGPALPA